MASLTPAMLTVLREAPDEWALFYAHGGTVEALERRGLLEAEFRRREGRFVLDLYVRRTEEGRAYLGSLGGK